LVTSLKLCLGYPVKEKKEMERKWKEEDDDFDGGGRGKKSHRRHEASAKRRKDFVRHRMMACDKS
jgi:hypothetical protein